MARRKRRFITFWNFLVALSLCLNAFGFYTLAGKWWAKQGFVKREAIKLAWDGCKYRMVKYFED